MANPNIVNVTDIRGKTVTANLSTSNNTLIVENTASSNKIYKINSLYVSNVDGEAAVDVSVTLHSQANISGTVTEICKTVSVPADSTLIVISKDSSIYLEEDKSIGAQAGSANGLKVICSYEEIS